MVFMRSTSIDEKVTRTSFDIPESASTSTSLAEVESCLNLLFEDSITFAASETYDSFLYELFGASFVTYDPLISGLAKFLTPFFKSVFILSHEVL